MDGADENRRILKEAADQGKFSSFSVELLKRADFYNVNLRMPGYPTAIFAEILKNNVEGIKILLDAGAHTSCEYLDPKTGISYAICRIDDIDGYGYDADDESATLAERLEFKLKIIATTEESDKEANVEEGARDSEERDNSQAHDADKMEEENDSMLQLEDQQTHKDYDNNPFLEKAIDLVILFTEIERDTPTKPQKEEDETPDLDTFYKSAEYRDYTSVMDGMPEMHEPYFVGLLPEVSSILA